MGNPLYAVYGARLTALAGNLKNNIFFKVRSHQNDQKKAGTISYLEKLLLYFYLIVGWIRRALCALDLLPREAGEQI